MALSKILKQIRFSDTSIANGSFGTDNSSNLYTLTGIIDNSGNIITPATDGTDSSTAVAANGASGIRGWLSLIYQSLIGGAPNPSRTKAVGSLAAANASVSLPVDGMGTGVIRLSGTWAGSVVFLGSVDDGTTYDQQISMIPYTGGTSASSATGNGTWEINVGGLTHIQANMNVFTSGSVTVLITASNTAKSQRIGTPSANPLPITNQGFLASGKTTVTATLTTTSATPSTGISGVFTPLSGRGFAISGDGTGTVQMTKLLPGDSLWRPITAAGTQLNKFTGPFAEEWSTDITGTQFRFEMTAVGTMNVRFDQ